MADSYQQFRPTPAFRDLVDAYWINRPGGADGALSDRVLPDGCIDLIFRGGDGAGLFSSALIERPIYFESGLRAWFVGVRFRPAMARAILDIEPVDCRDRDIPAAMIDSGFAALEEELQACASPEVALALLGRRVDARLARRERFAPPARVREAVTLLARGGNAVQVHRVALALGIAERSLHRDLVRWTGLAPKSMARILRMQRTIAAIRAGRMPLADLALRMGYADQAHMTRELTELAGFTPSEVAPARNRRAVRNLQDAA
jgi:AraC-like DNA-binding protein